MVSIIVVDLPTHVLHPGHRKPPPHSAPPSHAHSKHTSRSNTQTLKLNVTASHLWLHSGTLNGSTLLILFSNSAHRYTGVVFAALSCIRWDNGHVWARENVSCPAPSPTPPPPPPPPPVAVDVPEWTAHAIIYEIAPKAFTSPSGIGKDGSGSGTLYSAAQMLPGLADVGVNAVWLAGWALSNKHFRGIWSTYAAVDLGVIDPTLGGPDGLQSFVATAHAHGIKVRSLA